MSVAPSDNVIRIDRGELWSINSLADEFGKGWNQVKKALRDVPPDGAIKGNPAWRVSTAAPHLVQPINPPPLTQQLEIDEMDPKDRLDWVKSERELMKLRTEARDLISASEVRESYGLLVKLFANGIDTLVDDVEQKCGLSAGQAAVIQKRCDELREQLYSANEQLLDP